MAKADVRFHSRSRPHLFFSFSQALASFVFQFLAGAGRPLLPSMIDYSVFSQSAAARGSIISAPVSRSATAFNFCI